MLQERLTTIIMRNCTTAEEIVEASLGKLEEYLIPLEHLMFVATDSSSSMLGSENGVHLLIRRKLPHLPCWGGCVCHYCSNLLKVWCEFETV